MQECGAGGTSSSREDQLCGLPHAADPSPAPDQGPNTQIKDGK